MILKISNSFIKYFNNGMQTNLLQRVDMVVGSLTMTSEREEVIDFVAPYFEQTGFSIGMLTIFYIHHCF